jgi:hypothetical protein
MSYAHYAHRGAYPLVATALLAGLFVLITFRSGGAGNRSPAARGLVYLWLGQNIFLLVSTIWRLWLYVDAYSLTRLRLAAVIWIVLVAVGFVLLIAKIVTRRSNAWLWRTNAVSLAIVLCGCAFVDFPGGIAHYNVRHCREVDGKGASLDLAYLEELGPATLPALQWVRWRMPWHETPRVLIAEHRLREELDGSLADWRSWTYRRQRIAEKHKPVSPTVMFQAAVNEQRRPRG